MSVLLPVLKTLLKAPSKPAITDDRGRTSRIRLLGGAMFVAENIEQRTSKPHVGIMLPSSSAFVMSMLGVWLTGRTIVPFNFLLSPKQIDFIARDSDIDMIITARPMIDFLGGTDGLPKSAKLFFIDEMDTEGFPPFRWPSIASRRDVAALMYTSGTSGMPKGVELTHGNLDSDVRASVQHAGLSRSDAFLGVLPQFHSFGLTALTLIPLYIGSPIIYSARFVPRTIIQLMKEHKPEIFVGVPAMYNALLTVKEAKAEDLSSIRMAISGGEPLPLSLYEAFKERFGIGILEGYGLTETAPVTHWSTPRHNKLHSVGRALPGVKVLIVDEQDKPVKAGQPGEILLAGPNLMRGYHNQPELTESVITQRPDRHGKPTRFFRTGDIGYEDEDGFLFITGRKKEMLIIAGENVFPREIEEVLNSHPSVHASAVIGKPDGVRGEVPVAFVELEEGADLDESALKKHCREHLAPFKVPRSISRIDQLPRSATGKILRRQIQSDGSNDAS
ncbi:MAG: AMP-binding protein [Phycisphaeraceae bacterium]|nr:AMP-binding protein [Phycisphaeraceae bacterium]